MKILSTFLLAGIMAAATPIRTPQVPEGLLGRNAGTVHESDIFLMFAGGLFVAAGLARRKQRGEQSNTPDR